MIHATLHSPAQDHVQLSLKPFDLLTDYESYTYVASYGAWLFGGNGVAIGERIGEAGTPPEMEPPPPPAPVGDPELIFDILPWSFTTG